VVPRWALVSCLLGYAQLAGVKGLNIVDLWTVTPGGRLQEKNGGTLVEGLEGPRSAALGSVTQQGVFPLQFPF
jgi:hypothetical protein